MLDIEVNVAVLNSDSLLILHFLAKAVGHLDVVFVYEVDLKNVMNWTVQHLKFLEVLLVHCFEY